MQDIFMRLAQYEGALPASWSRILTLLRCPRQFDLKYRKRVKESVVAKHSETTDFTNTRAGKDIHWVLEKCVDRITAGYNDPVECYEHFFNFVRDASDDAKVHKRLDLLKEPTRKVLERVIRFNTGPDVSFRTERMLRLNRQGIPVDRGSWGTLGWSGYVDLEITKPDSILILDYKSENYSPEREELTRQQTEMYAWVELLKNPSIKKVYTGCAYLLDNDIRIDEPYTRDSMEVLEKNIRKIYEKYLSSLASYEADPRMSSYCRYCAYAADCPALGAHHEKNNEEDDNTEANKEDSETSRFKAVVEENNSTDVADSSSKTES